MPQNIYEFLWVFLVYAVLGWITEVIYAGVNEGKFVNRGFLNGPYCPIYGLGVLVVLAVLYPIREHWVLLFLGSLLLTTALEFITGFILEKIFHNKWWDYTDVPFNICGYVCLKFSILWGLGCTFIIDIVHPMIYYWIRKIPDTLDLMLLSVILFLLVVDISATIADILAFNKRLRHLDEIAENMRKLSNELGEEVFEKTSAAILKKEDLHAKRDAGLAQLEALKSEFDAKIKNRHRGSERLIHAFPKITSKKWGNSLEKYKDILKELNSK